VAPDESVHLRRAAKELISRHVDSAGSLDLLLLLHARRDRDWSLPELCGALRCPAVWAEEQIQGFMAIGVVIEVSPGRFRYWRESQYATAVDEVARVCRRDRASVTRLIFARSRRPQGQFAR
jgi:hypothetical protein